MHLLRSSTSGRARNAKRFIIDLRTYHLVFHLRNLNPIFQRPHSPTVAAPTWAWRRGEWINGWCPYGGSEE